MLINNIKLVRKDDIFTPNSCAGSQGSLLGGFLSYLKKPDYSLEESGLSMRSKFFCFFRLWSLAVIVAGILGGLASVLIQQAGYDTAQNSVVDLFFSQPVYVFIFLALIWAPFTEEMTFRLWLRYSPYRLGFALVLIFLLILNFLAEGLPEIGAWFTEVLAGFSLAGRTVLFLVLVSLFGFVLGSFFVRVLPHEKIRGFYHRRFAWIFYGSTAVFGLVHIFNYYNLGSLWYLVPFLVLPQLIFGAIFAYVRMLYGVGWAMIGHFVHNAVISAPVLVFAFVPPRILEALQSGESTALEKLGYLDGLLVTLFSFSLIILALAVVASVIGVLSEYWKTRPARD